MYTELIFINAYLDFDISLKMNKLIIHFLSGDLKKPMQRLILIESYLSENDRPFLTFIPSLVKTTFYTHV